MSTLHEPTTASKVKQYVRPMPATWWLHNRHLGLFMLREVSAVFIGLYAAVLMVLLYMANRGPDGFRHFVDDTMKAPWWIATHVVFLIFALVHSVTFFNLTPKVVIVRQGEDKVPDVVIAGAHYVLWLVVSVILIGLAL